MGTAYDMVIWVSLVALLALLVGMLSTVVWRHLTRQLTRSGLVVFLIGAGIATVEAQKTIYVDINAQPGSGTFRTIQDAFDYLDGKRGDDVDIVVAPGVYPPVDISNFHFGGTTILTPYFDLESDDGPWTVVIDGGGVSNGITAGYSVLPREWHGIVVSNALIGAVGSCFSRCVATCCKVGFADGSMSQCLAYGNTGVGALNCSVAYSLIADNHGKSDEDAVYDSTGAQDCSIEGSIVWGNTKDGQKANWSNCWGSGWHGSYCCTDPILPGDWNICADPMFVNSAEKDYHLRMGSPCINSVLEIYLYEYEWTWPFDFDGNPRVQRGFADIGPYEYQPTNEHQTITAPVPVEFEWVDEKCPEVLAACGGDYDKAVLMKSANPVDISLPEPLRTYYSIWESYVADLDPANSNQTFRATIEMVDGKPCVKGDPESPNRRYTVLGKETLADEAWKENSPDARFFKVKVGLK